MSEAEPANLTALPQRPGERLRDARLAAKLELGDIAARTRIPQRHLESIEASNYSSLPSTTYAIGFARAYARAVELDEVAIAAEVRAELDRNWDRPALTVPVYEVEDPSRTPSRALVWGGVLVALALLIGAGLWYGTDILRGRSAPAPASQAVAVPIPETVAPAPTPTPGGGAVVLTATDEVWVHISAAGGQTLLMKTMTPGERFELPADAQDPRIEAGRPDKLAITVGGNAVPPLGDGRVAIRDVSLAPAALLGRGGAAPAAAPTPAPTATTPLAPLVPRAATPSPQARRPSPTPTPDAPLPRAFEPAFGNSAAPL